jgi:Kinesin motor domain
LSPLLITLLYSTLFFSLPVSGIIPRVVEALFTAVTEADESIEFTFKVTYVEIYMEKIRDLLDESRVKVRIVLLTPDH